MTIAMKRNLLLAYLNGVDDKNVTALFTLLEEKIIEKHIEPSFTERQLKVLNERRASFLNGNDKGTDWQTMHDNIRKKRKTA